jgi:hypothetical protein
MTERNYFGEVDLGDEYMEEMTPTPELVRDFLALNPARGGPRWPLHQRRGRPQHWHTRRIVPA